jgi:hypothetical protein
MTGIMTAVAGSRTNVAFASGLFRRTYSGYFNDNVNYFDGATPTASAADTSPIGTPSNVAFTSYQWLGYWLATSDTVSSGSTLFQTSSEDTSWMWIGPTALTGYTTGNALINNGGGARMDVQTVSASTPLTVGQYYPIRIQYGVNNINTPQPASIFDFRVFSNSLGNYTTTMPNNVFYNSVTNGF